MNLKKVRLILLLYVAFDLFIGGTCAGFLPLSQLAAAQFTTVTGTVVDPNGIVYANGTIVSVLILPGGTSPTLNGLPYTPPTQPVGLDGTGSFTIQLADNTVLLPAATKWNFTVCSAQGTVQPAGGKGPVCFTLSSPITISGASQSITSNLNAVALALVPPTRFITISGNCGGTAISNGTTSVGNLGLSQSSAGTCALVFSPTVGSNSGTVLPHNCVLKNLVLMSVTAGVNASDSVATIYLQPVPPPISASVATALMCTLGTAFICFDQTHSVSALAGQKVSVGIATQAASTASGYMVSVDCQ